MCSHIKYHSISKNQYFHQTLLPATYIYTCPIVPHSCISLPHHISFHIHLLISNSGMHLINTQSHPFTARHYPRNSFNKYISISQQYPPLTFPSISLNIHLFTISYNPYIFLATNSINPISITIITLYANL